MGADDKAKGHALMACDNEGCKVATFIPTGPHDKCPGCDADGRPIVIGPELGLLRIGER